MNNDQWEQLAEMAKEKFRNVELFTEDLLVDTEEGSQKRGTQDVLIFTNGVGTFKLVRENHPVVLQKKELYSHRAGQSAQTQYKFSDSEFSHKLRVYKEKDIDEWEEVSLDKLGI